MEFAKIKPVKPPKVKQTMNERTNAKSFPRILISDKPSAHANIFIAVGIPIIAVAAEK